MTDSEITTTILRQIRDHMSKTSERLDRVEQRLLVQEHILRDVYGQVLVLNRHVKTRNDVAIEELRKRVSKLEKKKAG